MELSKYFDIIVSFLRSILPNGNFVFIGLFGLYGICYLASTGEPNLNVGVPINIHWSVLLFLFGTLSDLKSSNSYAKKIFKWLWKHTKWGKHNELILAINKFLDADRKLNFDPGGLHRSEGNFEFVDTELISNHDRANSELALKLDSLGFLVPEEILNSSNNNTFKEFTNKLLRQLHKTNYKNLLNLWEELYGPSDQPDNIDDF